ncbi:ATP-binding cassette sub-family A member 13 [Tachyglossus aculeatus]|uniref:ATP-binding cassette sub-family A member 13 n=1 Tax=Tachyglossus aculeatus TaxID=9261 RepID=UPI0018F42111|nr:ATP-binding cassette sub-family A member 13 [Tachyglossus aculeatus]
MTRSRLESCPKVLSVSEFLWPCMLFLILTVIRFEEPPRYRENCYLQPRDLPSQGLFLFAQSLLCNTGSRCKNSSYAGPQNSHFRTSRNQPVQVPSMMTGDLAFLNEMQDLTQGVSATMEKALTLRRLWMEESKWSSVSLVAVETLKPYFEYPTSPTPAQPGADSGKLWSLRTRAWKLWFLRTRGWKPQALRTRPGSCAHSGQGPGTRGPSGPGAGSHRSLGDPERQNRSHLKLPSGAQIAFSRRILSEEVLRKSEKKLLVEMTLCVIAGKDYGTSITFCSQYAPMYFSKVLLKSESVGFSDIKLPVDLNKTEEIISVLENLHDQPYIWNLLHSLSKLQTKNINLEDGIYIAIQFLQTITNSLATLEEISWLPLNQTISQTVKIGVNMTITALNFLLSRSKEGPEYQLSLRNMLWNAQVIKSQLKSQFVFDDFLTENILKHIYEMFQQRQNGFPPQLLTGLEQSLVSLMEQYPKNSEPSHVASDLHTTVHLLNESLRLFSHKRNRDSSVTVFQIFEELQFALRNDENLAGFIRTTCEIANYMNSRGRLSKDGSTHSFSFIRSSCSFLPQILAFPKDSLCYGQELDWKAIADNYLVFLKSLFHSPVTSVTRIWAYTKERLKKEIHKQNYEAEKMTFYLRFIDFLDEMFLPGSSNSYEGPKFPNLSYLTDMILNNTFFKSHDSEMSRAQHSALDTQRLSEAVKAMIEKTFAMFWSKNASAALLQIEELILSEINTGLQELWLYDVPKGEKEKLAILSKFLNWSISPKQSGLNKDFANFSENIINNLHTAGLLKQEQVTAALNTIYTLRNASTFISVPAASQIQEFQKRVTRIYQNTFKDKDAARLLQIFSSVYQNVHKFFSNFKSRDFWLIFLNQVSEGISDRLEEFNFQHINKTFAIVSESASLLHHLSEKSLCEKLFSVSNYLAFVTHSLIQKEGPKMEKIHLPLMILKQRFKMNENFRVSTFYYLKRLFNYSLGGLEDKCFDFENDRIPYVNYSIDSDNSLIQHLGNILSNWSDGGSKVNRSLDPLCTISWVQMLGDVLEGTSQTLKLELKFISSLQVGLRELSEGLKYKFNISEKCALIFPYQASTHLVMSLLKNITQASANSNWNDFQAVSSLLATLENAFASLRSFNTEGFEKAFLNLENTFLELKEILLNINISREFLDSLFEVLIELNRAKEYMDRNIILKAYKFSKSLLGSGEEIETVLTELREIMQFLRNESHENLISCVRIFTNVTKEHPLAGGSISQGVLTNLNSIFNLNNIVSELKSCSRWVDIINNLREKWNASSPLMVHVHDILDWFTSLGSVSDRENGLKNTMKFVNLALSIATPLCPLGDSNMNCVAFYFANVTDLLKDVLTLLYEKERIPTLEFISTLLNNSGDQTEAIINNLIRDLQFMSDSNQKPFTKLITGTKVKSNEFSNRFQDLWEPSLAFLREIQMLMKNLTFQILPNNSYSASGRLLKVFATFPKKEGVNLRDSILHLVTYLAFNMSHNKQYSPNATLQTVKKAAGFDIQVIRDVINFLMPSILPNVPQGSGNMQVLKTIKTLMRNLKNKDIELLMDQVEQLSESMNYFFKNIHTGQSGNSKINLLVRLMESLVNSSHSWSISHLWQFSRLFPPKIVNSVIDAYNMLPYGVSLLKRLAHGNLTEALKDLYEFTLSHGTNISIVTKEDIANTLKDLLDIAELVKDKPNISIEALVCFPIIWCQNLTTSISHENALLEACSVHSFGDFSIYSKMAGVLKHLRLISLGNDLQCSNDTFMMDITQKWICFLREFEEWNSIFLKVSEVFHIKFSIVKELQVFWHKVATYALPSGSQGKDNYSIQCTSSPMKQSAFQFIENLTNVNQTEIMIAKDHFEQLIDLAKGFYLNGSGNLLMPSNRFTLKSLAKFVSGGMGTENLFSFFLSLVRPLMMNSPNGNKAYDLLTALSNYSKNSDILGKLETLGNQSEIVVKDIVKDLNVKHLLSMIKEEINLIHAVAIQNISLPLVQFLRQLNSSLPSVRIFEDFLLTNSAWLHEYFSGNFSRIIHTLILLMANESSPSDTAWMMKGITDFLEHFKNVSREVNSPFTFLAHLLSQEKWIRFSLAHLLFEGILFNATLDIAGRSKEAVQHLNHSDLQVMDFIDLVFNSTQFENYGKNLSLYPSRAEEFIDQILQMFSSSSSKENFRNKIILLLKDFHKDIIAEMSIFPKDKIADILKLDPLINVMEEESSMTGIFSTLKERIYDLIKHAFLLENGTFHFDRPQELKFVKDVFNVLLREITMNNKSESHFEMVSIANQLLSMMNHSRDLSQLNKDLNRSLVLVRQASAELENLLNIIFRNNMKDFQLLYPTLQETVLAKLTELLRLSDKNFLLRNREAIEVTLDLLHIISQTIREHDSPEPLFQISNTLNTLLQDIGEFRGLAKSVDKVIEFLRLSKMFSERLINISETHFSSKMKGYFHSIDILFSVLQEAVHGAMNELVTTKNPEHLPSHKVEDLLKLFLNLTYWTIQMKPYRSNESEIVNMPASFLRNLSQSKDFSRIVEDISEFLTSVENDSVDLGNFMEAMINSTQNSPRGIVSLMHEVLNGLLPINDLTSSINLLNSKLNSTHHKIQQTKWEMIQEAIHFFSNLLSPKSSESELYLKMMVLKAFSKNLLESGLNVSDHLRTYAQFQTNFSQVTEAAENMFSLIKRFAGRLVGEALFFDNTNLHNANHQQLERIIEVGLSEVAIWLKWLPLQINEMKTVFKQVLDSFGNATIGEGVISDLMKNIVQQMQDFPHTFRSKSPYGKYLKGIIELTEARLKGPLGEKSVFEICQLFQHHFKPSEIQILQKVKMTFLNILLILTDEPTFIRDSMCAFMSCEENLTRQILFLVIRGISLVADHYQEIKTIWTSPIHGSCESFVDISRKLSLALLHWKGNLGHASGKDCHCRLMLQNIQPHMQKLAKSLEEPLSRNPTAAFLSNFSIMGDVKLKDCVQNITTFTQELLSSTNLSIEAINSILEANISHSRFLYSTVAVALAGRCDEEVLSLLLTFPTEVKTSLAVKELCTLPLLDVYRLLIVIGQNLNLRAFIYKTQIPSEADTLLKSLLDVVSSISSLLGKVQHILEYLPEFLQIFKNIALFDIPALQQFPQSVQSRSSIFGSLQSVMKMVCKDEASFFNNPSMFFNLPKISDLEEEDKTKFNIPKDSTPFCLKLYQEILQSPNGAVIWAFLKPVLHGKILYTPNIPEINKVIEMANYTFAFVDKLKSFSEFLLKISDMFKGSENIQMINQLQEALRNSFIRNYVQSQLQIDVEKLIGKLQIYEDTVHKMLNSSVAEQLHLLVRVMVNMSSCVLLDRFQPLDSVEILEKKARELMQQNNFLASIIFNSSLNDGKYKADSAHRLPHHIVYTIRTSVLYSMRTDVVKNPLWKFHPQTLPADGFKYNHIFVPLQDMIERAIILVQTGLDVVEPTLQAQAMPYPCHTSDLFLNNVGFFFPLIMMLTWMVSIASTVRKLVYEREIRLEEFMRISGVHPAVHFLAWFLENTIMFTISSLALAIILKASGIFVHSNACIIFLFLLDFGISVIMLSYFLGAFFKSASTAALWTSLLYVISFLPYIVLLVLQNQLSFAMQTVLCFLSTTAFGQGVFFITFLEGQETGIQWNNIYNPVELGGDMTFGWACWMILFDSTVYFVCGWYFSNCIPGPFGINQPWYFPFTLSYWQNLCVLEKKQQPRVHSDIFFLKGHYREKGSSYKFHQGSLEKLSVGVALTSVTKMYNDNRKMAVKDLTLTFYRNQITALLGPNGTGKTTIISMLAGLYPPTSGVITINGKDTETDLPAIRMELGVCLQQDVLFDNLTVREHLELFATLKAPLWTKKKLQQQVNEALKELELTHHQHKPTRALSGGMKRKLSIGISLIGNSKIVVLDEPTSGVDPCSRRAIWDILLKHRKGRTLIFTTHHLDEAEALSDRIAVLHHGRLHCCDSPSSLKETYGHGLSLTLTKQPSTSEIHDTQNVARITSLIQIYIPQALLKGNSRSELMYAIPKDADQTCFKGLFQALDQNLHHLHVTGYGISDTTLEEVFLKLLQDPEITSPTPTTVDLDPLFKSSIGQSYSNSDLFMRTQPPPGECVLLNQMVALLRKRFHHTRRGWKGTLSDIGLPVLFVALAMALFMVKPLEIEYPSLRLTPGHYGSAETYFFSSENDDVDLSRVLLRHFGPQDQLCASVKQKKENISCWQTDPSSREVFQDSCGCLKCPNNTISVPYLKNNRGHKLLNLSAVNVEEYVLRPSKNPRLGGWSFGTKPPHSGQEAIFHESRTKKLAKVWYNQKSFHSLPSYLNHLNNLILWQHLPPSVNWRQYGITLYSHPYGGALLNEDKILEGIRQCGVALCIVLGVSILTASIGSSIVQDRVSGAKRLQHISGLGYRTYWFTNFIYDMLFYLVAVSLCIGVIVAFQLTAFTFRENLAATALLLALFGYATLPWMYLMSRIFSSSNVAFISYVSLNFIFGLCTMLMTIMPRLLAVISKAENLQQIYSVLKWVFTIFPQFCLGQGLIELCYNQIKFDLTHDFGIDPYVSPFEMNFLGWIFMEMALQGTILLALRFFLHWDLLQKPRDSTSISSSTLDPEEDLDVRVERLRLLGGQTDRDVLLLYHLEKCYQHFHKRSTAVKDISLGIPRGECFGLLGMNGAGKSTTFRMLTGDIPPSGGRAVFKTPTGDEMDVSSANAAGILIGYCPQKDALDELLTGWEHLYYYCSLRGVPKQYIYQVAGDLVCRLHLDGHMDNPVKTYSGGTKRKLSTALALIGKPQILFLDEPSSGLDPCSKRYLWKTIMKEVREGCAAVLTSHSMEECEALCTRLGIMVNGSFKCLGSPQHIKNRFGHGYTVKIWLSEELCQQKTISDCLMLHFPGIQFKGQHLNLLEYHVPQRLGRLAELFTVLENKKVLLNIKHYSISQTTLEQVFIKFATQEQENQQRTPDSSTNLYHLHHLPI